MNTVESQVDYISYFNPTTGEYELLNTLKAPDDRSAHISVGRFSDKERGAFHQEKELRGLNYEYAGGPFPIPAPFTISQNLAKELSTPANELREYIVDKYLCSEAKITSRIAEDTSFFGNTDINSLNINKQLASMAKEGFLPPLHYDVLMVQGEQGKAEFKVVEHQLCTSYSYWLAAIHDAIVATKPNLSEKTYCEGDEDSSMSSLKNFSSGENIVVIDTHVGTSPTLPDKIGMAKTLGERESRPLSLLDIYRKNDKRMCHLRDKSGGIEGSVEIKNIYCRAMDNDLENAWEEANEQQREWISDFLKDENLNWIFHPSWSKLFTKAHTDELLNLDGTKKHYIPAYSEGDTVETGRYRNKPTNGNSNSGQENVSVSVGETVIVPDGRIFQERMNLYPFLVKVRSENSEKELPIVGTVEIRCFLLPCLNGNESHNFVIRFVPKYLEGNEETPTNVGGSVSAINLIKETLSDSTDGEMSNITQRPFGFVPVLIENKT